ncbi:MAG: hypothetical protein EON54_18235 [Alcaligenaceae bacterium]|nr:MAG: hypothetical protein EON54_18235 [Alcaligenaceae bacterium]
MAFLALVSSLFSYRLASKGNDTFRESLRADAYTKVQQFSSSLTNIENSLFALSRWTMNGVGITHEFGKFEEYKYNVQFHESVIWRMKSAQGAGHTIASSVNLLMRLDTDLKKLTYRMSEKNSQTLAELTDLGLKIDSLLRSYTSVVFDYFDDEERCVGMRRSQHRLLITDASVKEILEDWIKKYLNDIYKTTDSLLELCQHLNEEKLTNLYKCE